MRVCVHLRTCVGVFATWAVGIRKKKTISEEYFYRPGTEGHEHTDLVSKRRNSKIKPNSIANLLAAHVQSAADITSKNQTTSRLVNYYYGSQKNETSSRRS